MIKKITLYISLCFFCCCSTVKHDYTGWHQLIEGKWVLLNQTIYNYPAIKFNNNSGATFGSRSDTIFFFQYTLRKNDLLLKDIKGVQTHNEILKLTNDSLIFKTLLEQKDRQIYVRMK